MPMPYGGNQQPEMLLKKPRDEKLECDPVGIADSKMKRYILRVAPWLYKLKVVTIR
jgi:hypothetical protein